jgi:selenide,water dikinase
VGFNTADDAGVIKLNDEIALVQTVDIFTPIVDDPYMYGQISAANSLSDVYAMGGKPLSALNIVGFPRDIFPMEILGEILRGGQDKALEAGVAVIGGHTISDDELKYGMAVTGIVNPHSILTNSHAKAGDLLYLTKPIGTGTITTCLKAGKGSADMESYVSEIMSVLNRRASEVAIVVEANACTDITGFGLLGHAMEMAKGSKVSLEIEYNRVPILDYAMETTAKKFIPGGTKANRLYTEPSVSYASHLNEDQKFILNDPQTSGGLLISVPPERQNDIKAALQTARVPAILIGSVQPPKDKFLYIV